MKKIDKILHTKYGTAKIDKYGYYIITSSKEDNNKKLLHRLIATDYFGDWINDPKEPFDIHHIDGNKLNNCVLNLEPIPHGEHIKMHKTNKFLSDEHKKAISISKNTSGYYRVHKQKDKRCKQGFTWRYKYYENGKHKSIESVDIDKLEKKVKGQGLTWMKIEEEMN